ncbi:serine--tRNA ligase, partial [Patescibacteria group bacterium]|nr:serine--tRNA ligase [Patescibacteria group bacterium]
MLDINLIREKTDEIKQSLLKRTTEDKLDFATILKLDDERKELIAKADDLKSERNKQSKTKPTPEIIKQMKKIGENIKSLDEKLNKIEAKLNEALAELPNIVADDVVAGGKENNKVVKTFGDKPKFKPALSGAEGFTPKDHIELATELGLVDYERGAKMSGSGFWVYKGDGALLEWALLNYFVDFHKKNNYTFILPPYLLSEESAYTSGHLPKFRDDLYWTSVSAKASPDKQDKLCLNATSEMMLGNYHRDEILDGAELPLKYYAYSACFRREAGSYRKEERGMIRGHQFNKIEMFQFTTPENSWDAFAELLANAEKLVEGLGLHYQT